VFSHGYRQLDAILATKTPADSRGVDIDPTTADVDMAARQPIQAEMVRHTPGCRERRPPEQTHLA
jgi:hypothetical protein